MTLLPMTVGTYRPSPALAPYISHFGLREAALGNTRIYSPLPARSDCFLEIYLADRYDIVNVATGAVHRAPRLSLVGPHSRRSEDIVLSGTLRVFHIHFTAIGFRALFNIPTHLIADSGRSAEEVLGPQIADLAEQLSGVATPGQLIALAERFFCATLPNTQSTNPAIAAIARTIRLRHGAVEISRLAAAHQLTTRQVERAFREHVGVAPKTFARLARLSRALDLYRKDPTQEWTDIAFEAGFYDQSHMLRDFRQLTGGTPSGFAALRSRAAAYTQPETMRAEALRQRADVAFVLSPGA